MERASCAMDAECVIKYLPPALARPRSQSSASIFSAVDLPIRFLETLRLGESMFKLLLIVFRCVGFCGGFMIRRVCDIA